MKSHQNKPMVHNAKQYLEPAIRNVNSPPSQLQFSKKPSVARFTLASQEVAL